MSKITIASGTTTFGTICWMAYTQGKRGRLSPRFGKYENLIQWLTKNGHLHQDAAA